VSTLADVAAHFAVVVLVVLVCGSPLWLPLWRARIRRRAIERHERMRARIWAEELRRDRP
jgi:hypothetical protein